MGTWKHPPTLLASLHKVCSILHCTSLAGPGQSKEDQTHTAQPCNKPQKPPTACGVGRVLPIPQTMGINGKESFQHSYSHPSTTSPGQGFKHSLASSGRRRRRRERTVFQTILQSVPLPSRDDITAQQAPNPLECNFGSNNICRS